MSRGTSEFGKRMRRRYGAMGMLIVAPFVLLMAGVKVFEQHDYPAGDMRNEPWFWAAFGVAALIFVGIATISSIREIRRRDFEAPSPDREAYVARRRELGEPLETIVRVVVGVGILAVGISRTLETHRYPPGDFRNEPVTWIVVALVSVAIGGAALLSALWPRLRR